MGAEEIDPQGETPLYEQVAEILRGRIRSGEIPVGRAIPSRRAIEQEFEVGEKTALRAVAVLREEGLIRTSQGRGNYVQRTL